MPVAGSVGLTVAARAAVVGVWAVVLEGAAEVVVVGDAEVVVVDWGAVVAAASTVIVPCMKGWIVQT
jgi:hypothetical protein